MRIILLMSMLFIEFSGYRITGKNKNKMGIYECSFCKKRKEIHVSNSSKTKSCGCKKGMFLREGKCKEKIFIDRGDYFEFELSKGGICKIDKDDAERIKGYSWYKSVRGCVEVRTDKKLVKMHRFIMNPGDGKLIDHINRDPLDNRKCNLRICTHTENMRNTKNRTGNFKGVYFDKRARKFIARCRSKYLGSFEVEEEGAKAYDKEAKEVFGEFAYLNFPNG